MQIKFQVMKGGILLKEEILSQEVIKVGRNPGCHLLIEDEDISGTHAVIEVGGPGQVFVNDLGGITGTLVNGQPVGRSVLNNGDSIYFGSIEVRVIFLEAQQMVGAPASGFSSTQLGQAPATPGVQPGPTSEMPMAPLSQAPAMAQPTSAPFPMQNQMPAMQQQMSSSPAMPQFQQPMGMPQAQQPAMAVPASMPAAPISQAPAGFQAAAVDLSIVEDATRQATEVVVLWNGSVLTVNHYKPDEKKPVNYYIGEDPTCDFPIPAEALNGQTKVPLVINQLGGAATVTILPNVQGDVTYEDGSRVSVQELASSGQVAPSSDISGGFSFNLPSKARVKMDLGPWSFLVNSVASPRKFVAPIEFDWSSQIYTGFSLIMHFVFLALIYFIPPDPEGLSLDLLAENNRFVKYMLTPPEVQQDEIPEWLKKDKQDEKQGGKGKRHKGEEGQMGKRDAKKTDNHYGIKGPKDNPDPHMARSMAKEMAKNAGILSYLSAANAPTSPFGRDTALGVDPENALGALMGNQVGENFGYGGLGLRGTGRGGGGTGEGTIGLGNLNTIGHGGGGGSGSGYGRGAGGLGGRRGSAPRIRSGAAMVKGSLSKEVIRRIVHRHINEVKFCYERQLAKRPDLSGRVAVKFIISGTGAVQMAAVASSTLGDPSVENCIAQAVRRWTFPQPEGGGIVIVTYPFQLTAPEG
jgi:TonB family protein